MYLLFDIGASKIRLSTSTDLQTLREPKIIPTPQDFEEGVNQIRQLVSEVVGGEEIQAAAMGTPGPQDKDKTMMIGAINLPGWNGKPLKKTLEETLGIPFYIENDAALGGLGEATHGAGKDNNIVAFLTVSTGVGGVRIVEGRIDQNNLGFEPGGQYIIGADVGLGELISGNGLERKYHQKPEEIKDPKIWDEVAKYLAIGLNNILVLWSPDMIVLGGGVIQSIPLEKTEDYLKEICEDFPVLPPIKKAELGDQSGLYGAMVYLSQCLKG